MTIDHKSFKVVCKFLIVDKTQKSFLFQLGCPGILFPNPNSSLRKICSLSVRRFWRCEVWGTLCPLKAELTLYVGHVSLWGTKNPGSEGWCSGQCPWICGMKSMGECTPGSQEKEGGRNERYWRLLRFLCFSTLDQKPGGESTLETPFVPTQSGSLCPPAANRVHVCILHRRMAYQHLKRRLRETRAGSLSKELDRAPTICVHGAQERIPTPQPQGASHSSHTCLSMDLKTLYRSRLVRISPALPNVKP